MNYKDDFEFITIMECAICYEFLTQDKNFLVTDCSHKFHYSCFKQWGKDTCPMCRQEIVNTNDNIIEKRLEELFNSKDNVDEKELALYLHQFNLNNKDCVSGIYKSLILHNTKLLIQNLRNPVNYIMGHELYSLLPYYKYKEYYKELTSLDDVNLIKYLKFDDENTLYEIVKQGCKNLLSYVIDNDLVEIDINKVYSTNGDMIFQKVNLLGVACFYNHIDLLHLLIKYIDINSVNVWNCNALYPAISSHNLDIVKWLVKHGINIDITHICGNSPLYYAIELQTIDIVYYLINHGALVNENIIYACVGYSSNIRLLKKLLSLLPTKKLNTFPSYHVCSNRDASNYQHVDARACYCKQCQTDTNLNTCNIVSTTVLQAACYSNKFEMILLLLSFDNTCKNHQSNVCTYHTNWEALLPANFSRNNNNYTRVVIDNDLKQLLYMNNRYTEECKDVTDYIWKLIERDEHVSYKHRKKIVQKLLDEATKKIWTSPPSGLGLYRAFLYN